MYFFHRFMHIFIHIIIIEVKIALNDTVKVLFLARDRERTVLMYIPDIYQNDRDVKLNQKKFTLTITLTVTVTRQERNFHCPDNFKDTCINTAIDTISATIASTSKNGNFDGMIAFRAQSSA